jgi:hypothetical protein
VRVLVRYPNLREEVQDGSAFYFQFSRQIVDPNLAHFTPLLFLDLKHGRLIGAPGRTPL